MRNFVFKRNKFLSCKCQRIRKEEERKSKKQKTPWLTSEGNACRKFEEPAPYVSVNDERVVC